MTRIALLAIGVSAVALPALAEGKLNLYNWGDYTSPDLIKKFEDQTGIDVTITDYDSNDTALAKVSAGGHGFDLVVPSANYVPIFVQKGLLAELDHERLKNFGNIDAKWMDVPWDKGRVYSIPWLWGTVGMGVNTETYDGDPNTSAIFLDPPKELVGKVNVAPEMSDIIHLTTMYLGGEPCTEDKEMLKKVRDKLVEAKPKWMSMDYGMSDKMGSGDVKASEYWSGAIMRARMQNPAVVYGYPKEGYPLFMDSIALLADAQNVDEAYQFLDFIMDPENAAMNSEYAKYPNGIAGSEEFFSDEMKNAPEMVVPEEHLANGRWMPLCSPTARDYMTAIWTELQK
ncbi:MAG: extracellular solute-binding protein [Paracoccus sp. (in: a-proteobacteria)]|jgi:spermidine/putrescine transport system substrate-binding protein|uniref:extracellular solute-binding protein n=3 Tax=Paracoccus TaxID=265 RepID=UPI000C447E10|nr:MULTISPECIES: extracellular solute-binding protein [unclassified Paracoccus (in: a-proteobacteria)]MAN54914.1 putrescine/spermidine ABC transporter substrate-binding protein [Paracoccus sp. (in: a-proteobacteria)]MBA50250.1 putrescine/spermidine ABC transporter substrate-binding protein [Paracoccus sp. (in: a-proteobacteria)]HIC64686.1 extracellular solute-binding protein [Paracoccus sp. (in: a-proteobacteria)]|tara:strand:- start:2886 stop:3911 length:1026 start_codon:yes stop_codon:yes gene_type:complete